MMALMFAALLAAADPVAVTGTPPPAPARPVIHTLPDWARVPTVQEMQRYYPKLARFLGVGGRAVLACNVAISGVLRDCTVVSETPVALGFGTAALNVAPLMRMRPATVNGEAVDGAQVRVPVLFGFPGEPLPDLDGTLYCYGVFSAYMRGRPDDVRVPQAVERSRQRAEYLMVQSGDATDARTARLLTAEEALAGPRSGSKASDACFRVFLP